VAEPFGRTQHIVSDKRPITVAAIVKDLLGIGRQLVERKELDKG
jgi:hypothetical protein